MTACTPPSRSELLQDVRACTACEDLPLGPKPLLQWSPAAPILIAGQAPGRITHKKAIPFDDPSGNRLRDWLGVDRETFYDPGNFAIVPMAFCFPGTGSSGDLPPPPRCAELWREKLLEGLGALSLTIIIGTYATAWHLPEEKGTLTNLARKYEHFLPNRLVIPHPSPRNARWLARNRWFENDVLPRLKGRVSEILAKKKGRSVGSRGPFF